MLLVIIRIIILFSLVFTGLPTIFTIFGETVPAEERSSAFGYLIAAGTIGQTLAALLCPHLYWELSFYLFGSLGIVWVIVWIVVYNEVETIQQDQLPLICNRLRSKQIHLTEFFCHWPLWAIYIAHFAMNWSNYIIMQWLPTYLARYLGANKESISLTAVPYIINSLSGVGMLNILIQFIISINCKALFYLFYFKCKQPQDILPTS